MAAFGSLATVFPLRRSPHTLHNSSASIISLRLDVMRSPFRYELYFGEVHALPCRWRLPPGEEPGQEPRYELDQCADHAKPNVNWRRSSSA